MDHKFIKAKNFFCKQSRPSFLYKNIWTEGTTALLHSPRTVDKTATALAIANELSGNGREVLYVNANRLDHTIVADSDNLYIYTPEFESIDDSRDYADIVFEAIEDAVRTTSIRTFVIDSVSRIAALSFGRNASVAFIMKRLVALQVKCRVSLLVLADDTTRSANNALFALAASEISIADDGQTPSSKIVKTDVAKPESKFAAPQTPVVMTSQQRRALERKQSKSYRRVNSSPRMTAFGAKNDSRLI